MPWQCGCSGPQPPARADEDGSHPGDDDDVVDDDDDRAAEVDHAGAGTDEGSG